ncbi:hypothetical protein HELRODRAFT_92151 [Helobdella robusta]|uniref:Fucose mutarotase n=1 Tax=Helobdella robusta TaxID=6412 RepID=T1G8C4_HELRO|nr:hypothetical protein HELRODRAFT_92151 [Helobdella robusta]ESO09744.1 hypothetical protein HELRODRAFT_92151 [Helobdella robusta]
MPLNGIPFIISPDLLHTLSSAGHGDEIVLADAHFPTSSVCRGGCKEIRADGCHNIPDLLDAILKLYPLDPYVPHPATVMRVVPNDPLLMSGQDPPIWQRYIEIIKKYYASDDVGHLDRFDFYDQARKSFAVVATGEVAQYGNIIIKKGIVKLES